MSFYTSIIFTNCDVDGELELVTRSFRGSLTLGISRLGNSTLLQGWNETRKKTPHSQSPVLFECHSRFQATRRSSCNCEATWEAYQREHRRSIVSSFAKATGKQPLISTKYLDSYRIGLAPRCSAQVQHTQRLVPESLSGGILQALYGQSTCGLLASVMNLSPKKSLWILLNTFRCPEII